jgi:AcrR family transcriptional regulator
MRQRLVAAARLLFARQGYEATTLKQVVTEAETSIGNCYFYFTNQGTLLLAVAEQFRCEVGQEVDAAIAPLPFGPPLLVLAVYTGVLAVPRQPALARGALFETAHPIRRRRLLRRVIYHTEGATHKTEKSYVKRPIKFAFRFDRAKLGWQAGVGEHSHRGWERDRGGKEGLVRFSKGKGN